MKTKIITSVVLSTIMAWLLVWAVSADFTNFTSEERTEIKTLMQKSKAWETLSIEDEAKIDEIKANFKWKKGESKGEKWNRTERWEKGERGDKDGNWEKRNSNLTDEERTTIKAMSEEDREEYREDKKLEREEKREKMKALMQKSRAGEELNEDEQAQVNEAKANFKGKKGDRIERNWEKKGNWNNR